MSIWDFLKRKKEIEKAKDPSRKAKLSTEQENQPEKKADGVLDVKPSSAKATEGQGKREKSARTKSVKGFSYDAVKEPHISEKATILSENNKYTFKVDSNYNKQEIKKSVEGVYGVDVLSVNIIKIPSKKRRLGRIEGLKKGYVKAVVTIKKGQKIEVI